MTAKQVYKPMFIIQTTGKGKSKKKTKIEVTSETKCSYCPGSKCCNYFTEQVQTPRTKKDFDHLLWQLAHGNTQLYKDDEGWFLLVNNKCNFLQDDGRCGIYETRPAVCREYTNTFCELDQPAEEGFDLFFDGYESLLKYCKKRYKRWDQRFEK